jgi:hypothetical protein
MTCSIPDFKRGQTFNGAATYTPEAGWPTDLSGVTVITALRDQRNQLHYFDVTMTDATHFTVRSDATESWHTGTAYWDIKFSTGEVVFYSETILLNILPNVTPNNS